MSEVKRNTAVLRKARKIVQEVFGINVMQLEREDMDKPLQNAIVARLFLHSKVRAGYCQPNLMLKQTFGKNTTTQPKAKAPLKDLLAELKSRKDRINERKIY